LTGLPDEFDVVVAGGGIAALTAGLYSARLGRSTLVLAGGAPGGLLLSIEQIEGMPGFPDGVPGYELCPIAQEQAEAAGAEFRLAELEGLEPQGESWLVSTGEGDFLARAVILATGSSLKELGVRGEERLRGHGVSHCASCDAPLLRDRVVGVVGGGDSAAQEALTLASSVSEVVILCRGDELSAQATYQRRILEHPKISVRYRTVVEEILGEETVTGVRTRDLETDAVADLELAALFVYVGLQPNTGLLEGLLALDEAGRIQTDGSLRAEPTGLLAAGTIRSGSSGQAAGAAGDGAAAAVAADRYLADGTWAGALAAVGGSRG
jgi:thioredoxin reductase (NADPH)